MKHLLTCLLLTFFFPNIKAQTCDANFGIIIFSPTGTGVRFSNNSSASMGGTIEDFWDFGDGINVSSAYSPTNYFPNNGIYLVMHSIVEKVNNQVVCTDSIYKTFFLRSTNQIYSQIKYEIKRDPIDSSKLTIVDSSEINFLLHPGIHSVLEMDFGGGSVPFSGKGYSTGNQYAFYKNGDSISTHLTNGVYYPCFRVYLISPNKDTIFRHRSCDSIPFIMNYSGTFCQTNFNSQSNTANGLSVDFKNNSQVFGSKKITQSYSWDFGDGNTSTDKDPTHTYLNDGTYSVCLTHEVKDSLTQSVLCTTTECENINVNFSCKAQFYIDTLASVSGVLNIWNSVVNHFPPTSYDIKYEWDFGDGNSSTQAYPTHIYAAAGKYLLCLKTRIIDLNSNDTCFAIFCDSVGMDSLGNLLYKTFSGGFMLNVQNPNIGLTEKSLERPSIYPNPANNFINISFKGMDKSQINYSLLDIRGAQVLIGESAPNNGLISIGTSTLPDGFYILTVSRKGQSYNQKLFISH